MTSSSETKWPKLQTQAPVDVRKYQPEYIASSLTCKVRWSQERVVRQVSDRLCVSNRAVCKGDDMGLQENSTFSHGSIAKPLHKPCIICFLLHANNLNANNLNDNINCVHFNNTCFSSERHARCRKLLNHATIKANKRCCNHLLQASVHVFD